MRSYSPLTAESPLGQEQPKKEKKGFSVGLKVASSSWRVIHPKKMWTMLTSLSQTKSYCHKEAEVHSGVHRQDV